MEDRKTKRTILIRYERWGGNFYDQHWWTGIFEDTGDVYDYHTKETLKADAERDGYAWKVLRYHKDGRISVMETSEDKK